MTNEEALTIASIIRVPRSTQAMIHALADFFNTATPGFNRQAFLEEAYLRECHVCGREFSPINEYYEYLCSTECLAEVKNAYSEALDEVEANFSNPFNAYELEKASSLPEEYRN